MLRKTERLEIIPLNLYQLGLWISDLKAFEKDLNCTYEGEALEGFMQDYIKAQIATIEKDGENYLFHTFWLIICKDNRIAVGTAAFKGIPNQAGEIEIGYGLGKKHEHNGFMTEAVGEICKWGLKQVNVRHIIAETDLDGYASQRILERNGFIRYGSEDCSCWRL